jgi:Spy/CpxP family protein refolding chaperone
MGIIRSAALFLLLSTPVFLAMAQGPPPGGPGGPPPHGPGGPPSNHGNAMGPGGRWWTDPALVSRLALSSDQQKRIDTLFQQDRLKLIDLTASVEKEEAILEPLLELDQPDEKNVLAQIDRIAQARAELEKANARMLLGFRSVLTGDQWRKLQAESRPGPRQGRPVPPDDRHK